MIDGSFCSKMLEMGFSKSDSQNYEMLRSCLEQRVEGVACLQLAQQDRGSAYQELRNSLLTVTKRLKVNNVPKESIDVICAVFELFVSDRDSIVEFARNPSTFRWAMVISKLGDDRQFILEAVKKDGYNLEDVADHLKNDKEIVLAALQQQGDALRYVPETLKEDEEVLFTAVQQYGGALCHVPSEQKSKGLVLAALQQEGDALRYVPETLKEDEDVLFTAVQQDGSALRHVPSEQKSKGLVLAALQQSSRAFNYVPNSLKEDEDIALEAVKQKIAIYSLETKFKTDAEFLLKAIAVNWKVIYDCRGFKEDRDFLKRAIQISPLVLGALTIPATATELPPWLEVAVNKIGKLEIRDSLTKICWVYQETIENNLWFFQEGLNGKEGVPNRKAPKSKQKRLNGQDSESPSTPSLPYQLKIIALALLPYFSENIEALTVLIFGFENQQGDLKRELRNMRSGLLQSVVEMLILQDPAFTSEELRAFFLDFPKYRIGQDAKGKEIIVAEKINPLQMRQEIAYTRIFLSTQKDRRLELAELFANHSFPGRMDVLKEGVQILISSYVTTSLDRESMENILKSPRILELAVYLHRQECNKEELSTVIDRFLQAAATGENAFKEERYQIRSSTHSLEIANTREYLWEAWKQCDRLSELLPRLPKDIGRGEYIEVSDKWEDLLACGTDVSGSCQRVDGDPHFTKCLPAYILDGKNQLLCVKDVQGKLVSRVILRLLFKDQEIALFMERYYGDEGYEDLLKRAALMIAKSLEVELYQAGEGVSLRSLGSAAPYEYCDAIGHIELGITRGSFSHEAELVQEESVRL